MRYMSLLFFLGLVACPGQPVTPNPDVGGGVEWCPAAEKHLLNDLDCRDRRGIRLGTPNKRGVAFVDVCRTLYSDGVNFKAKCLAQAKDCEEVMTSCVP